MAKALGLAQSWTSNAPQTEAAWFERIDLKPGEATIVSGGFTRNGTRCVASYAEKIQEDLLLIHYMDSSFSRAAGIHRGDQALFSDALSLAW